MEGARTGRRRIAPQAISPVQQRRPQPAAETGRSCWDRVLIFQSPAKGAAEKSANATRKALTARFRRGSQPVGMSTGRTAAKIENPNLFSIGEGFGFFVFFGKLNECSKGYPMVTCTSTTAPSGASGSRLPSMGLPSTATLFTPYWTAAVLSTAM